MVGNNKFEGSEYQYPKQLIEINRKPLIELVLECLKTIKLPKRFIFIVNAEDCQKYSLDSVLRLISETGSVIIELEKETKGAVCSALMAIEHINNDDALLISNSDQILDYDLDPIISRFLKQNLDAGTVCFDSVHPKWSYVRLDEDDYVIETAEKRPISRAAIAGLYFYKHGSEFVSSAMRTIEKNAIIGGQYYISSTFNELILDSKKIGYQNIPTSSYHHFYSAHRIKEYEYIQKQ